MTDVATQRLIKFRRTHQDVPVFDVIYDDLMAQPIDTVRRIYEHFGLQWSEDFRLAMVEWLRENPQGKQGRNTYTLEEFGFTRESIGQRYKDLTFTRERWIQRIFTKSLFALCSLTFFNVNNSIIIKEFLQKLPSPHHLHYLSLNFTWSYDADIQDMIRTIFKLPNLRRLEWWSYWVEESFGIVDDPSLSLEHFSIDCNESYHFLQILPFMPNLITLKLSYKFDSFDLISVQANSLSKLKSLHAFITPSGQITKDPKEMCEIAADFYENFFRKSDMLRPHPYT
ncbi:unnamed protein product, partial [Rotaria sp. Silwood2]